MWRNVNKFYVLTLARKHTKVEVSEWHTEKMLTILFSIFIFISIGVFSGIPPKSFAETALWKRATWKDEESLVNKHFYDIIQTLMTEVGALLWQCNVWFWDGSFDHKTQSENSKSYDSLTKSNVVYFSAIWSNLKDKKVSLPQIMNKWMNEWQNANKSIW